MIRLGSLDRGWVAIKTLKTLLIEIDGRDSMGTLILAEIVPIKVDTESRINGVPPQGLDLFWYESGVEAGLGISL